MTLDSIRTIDTMTEPQAWPIEKIEPRDGGISYLLHLDGGDTILRTADELAAAGITPPPDPVDFDALPVGTEVRSERTRWNCVKGTDGNWYGPNARNGCGALDPSHGPYTVVHVPDAPSVRTALHTIGLTDQEIANIVNDYWPSLVIDKIRDAAKAAENER